MRTNRAAITGSLVAVLGGVTGGLAAAGVATWVLVLLVVVMLGLTVATGWLYREAQR